MMKMMNAESKSYTPFHWTRKSVPKDELEAGNKIMKMLQKADMNNDGCYSKDEIKKALKNLGAYFPGWKANRCLKKLDADKDGKINGDEIDDLVNYLIHHGFGKK
ncbi:unnamed protein product [Lathyrus sativus]|nr:unnamed protein product [Lathyrus sativus]